MRQLLLSLLAPFVLCTACKKDAPPPAEAPKVVAEVKPADAVKPAEPPKPADGKAARVIELKVTAEGFQPGNVTLKKDEPVTFVVTRVSDETCATELLIAGTDIKADLPLNKPVEIAWTPTKAGQVKFGCAMDMMVSGMLLVE
ncbi:MAG: cupredoxin domain-containing protein [Myxococcaceae bacterium]|nr:cupredoxin domain-containing protein [Myxococcaceae bacterium]